MLDITTDDDSYISLQNKHLATQMTNTPFLMHGLTIFAYPSSACTFLGKRKVPIRLDLEYVISPYLEKI